MARFALGAICNYLNSIHPYIDFIANARAHGYEPEKLIVCYSHGYKPEAVERLRHTTNLELVQMNYDQEFVNKLKKYGLTKKEINFFLRTPEFDYHQLIPYGKRRNLVILKSLISEPKLDYLFFIDTDVKPRLLTSKDGNLTTINFFGRHLEYLEKENVVITTSDYSGYYIIPPLDFEKKEELLKGLQKEDALEKVKDAEANITVSNIYQNNIRETDKILGGNHAIDLSYSIILPPFYSTTYHFNGDLYLGRGEDTLLGLEIPDGKHKIIDIDTHIFHDTYDNFPKEPSIYDSDVQERLFYACTGWLGRNPFLNWYLKKYGYISASEFKKRHREQKLSLQAGAPKLAEYTGNDNFKLLPDMFSSAWMQLDQMVENYEDTIKNWQTVMKKITERRENR
ncbi:MAG: hypothetical protein ACQESS_01645 [Bacillota bacterium]